MVLNGLSKSSRGLEFVSKSLSCPRRPFPGYHHGGCVHLVGMFLSCTPRAFSLSALRRRLRGSRYCNARPRFSPLVLKERLEGTKVKRFPWWRRIRGNVLRPGEKREILKWHAYKWKVMAGGWAMKRSERKKRVLVCSQGAESTAKQARCKNITVQGWCCLSSVQLWIVPKVEGREHFVMPSVQ